MGLLDLLLPERCVACARDGAAVCAGCLAALRPLRPPLCERCGAQTAWPVERCRECAGRRLAFDRARAAVAYEGAATSLVLAWKEGGRRYLGRIAAAAVARELERPAVDALAYVPAARARELWRGHNPAERLAAELGRLWGLPVAPLLARATEPRPQRGLTRAERRRNVAGAFVPRGAVPGSVALCDDVYTSGATVAAAAAALRGAGARRIEVVTFARALRGGGPREPVDPG
ncbi:MAG: ComF family protein [Thermoleophilia bacterium]|nr:ComF family protein [Thermoleophilia bacterium]